MEKSQIFQHFAVTRQRFKQLIEKTSLEQLNEIPDGFANNIIWNFAHVIATHQLIVYAQSGLIPPISQDFIAKYKKGTRPTDNCTQAAVSEILTISDKAVETFQADLERDIFNSYTPYQTSYGVKLSTCEAAMSFAPVHEAMHLGMCISRLK